ncbi:MAG: 3'-5' exonuclease [Spirochaetaceae bacterium]|jgi:DNA polymerase-3 subunit epsilon|nr:3'-5' exonuclease [Spirochaetaceae bacterium]
MNFVAIDFETADYSPQSACSIGLVKFHNGAAVDSFYSLIRPPELYVYSGFTEIHGLTVDDIKDAPAFVEIWERAVRPFIGGLPLAAHNAVFDMGVLRAVLDWYALPVPAHPYFCTLALARRVWPELKSHALTALARHFGITYAAHHALADAETCGSLVRLAALQCGSTRLADLLSCAGVPMQRLGETRDPAGGFPA